MQRLTTTAFLFSLWIALISLSAVQAFAPQPAQTLQRSSGTARSTTELYNLKSLISNWGKTVKASHILIMDPGQLSGVLGAKGDEEKKGMRQDEAVATMTQWKEEIDNDPVKFAEYAEKYSCCPSNKNGGSLGEFGPGKMIGPFDKVCFNEEVGVVHGPIWTPFGQHLIYIEERNGGD